MLDFMKVFAKEAKSGKGADPRPEVFPRFIVKKTEDLMIRGGDFYAIWNEDKGLWSTDEYDAVELIDRDILAWATENGYEDANILYMRNADNGVIDRWHKYCQKQLRDSFHELDSAITFSDTEVTKESYVSKRLSYPLVPCETPAYDELMSTLYSPEERRKIEWAIGAVVTGNSTWIQKFLVLYGAAGTGKSTVLNIIQQLFDGYYSTFDSEALGSASNVFALEAFKTNPLVAIQHDGNLARIETNTRLNSLVSHEEMTVNEKFHSVYTQRFRSFLFMGTNKPVKITDAKSGLIRRIIDVSPTGAKVPFRTYTKDMKQIKFELGGIACHCRDIYLADPEYYDDYIPLRMLEGTNDFFNFVMDPDTYRIFYEDDYTTLASAWTRYNAYCDEAHLQFRYSKTFFREELKNYFKEYKDRGVAPSGTRTRNLYLGFKPPENDEGLHEKEPAEKWITEESLTASGEIFDEACADCQAQYASEQGRPSLAWDNVKTTLKDIDTKKLHYVRVPESHIVIDFDLKDESGEKDLAKNLAAAESWKPTYAEVSKSGKGLHLHYIYDGDPEKLARIYSPNIEVKVFSGKSSLRRISSRTNSLPIAHIGSGLPLVEKKGGKMVDDQVITDNRGLHNLIVKCLNKEYDTMPSTKQNIDFIKYKLDEMYESGAHYDIEPTMQDAILSFAMGSSHNSDYCIDQFREMKFHSDEPTEDISFDDSNEMVFFDCEVYPNYFLVVLKQAGENGKYIVLENPKPEQIERLQNFKLVGFNNLSYDNPMLWACLMGYSNEQLYELSQSIIEGHKNPFPDSKGLSYTDVYDFCAKKQSLKKWEIELGIHHQEMGIPWDQPVPEELKKTVIQYCKNDVAATEAVFNANSADFTAREILADLAGMTPNDRNSALTARIIFGNEKHPQLVYTDLSKEFPGYHYVQKFVPLDKRDPNDPDSKWYDGKPHNIYRGIDVGFGGYVYAVPGIHSNVFDNDIASMHPNSIIQLNLFGEYTPRFKALVDARVAIKHALFDKAAEILSFISDKVKRYLVGADSAVAKALGYALKIVINSVYGLTSASFPNPFRDPRNVNNIVALRGALFMKTLQDEVIAHGFKVVHIKTDSIKIADATPDIVEFCNEFGKKYGYTFEQEAIFNKLCLVNDAVYVAYGAHDSNTAAGKWTATGKQFQVPVVFKTLFSKEPLEFKDYCVTFATKDALYLDTNEGLPDVTAFEMELKDTERLRKDPSNVKLYARYAKKYPFSRYLVDDSDFEERENELKEDISKGHNYQFVGRIGEFVPVKTGCGGGLLLRGKEGKYYYPSGAKGYRWKESEIVRTLGKESEIDRTYFDSLINDAKATIEEYGDFEQFVEEAQDDIPF